MIYTIFGIDPQNDETCFDLNLSQVECVVFVETLIQVNVSIGFKGRVLMADRKPWKNTFNDQRTNLEKEEE